MIIVKISINENGTHNNQTIYGTTDGGPIPEGYALLPESLGTPETLKNFPCGEITVADVDGVPTVTSWTPLPMPEPEPVPEPEPEPTTDEILSALLWD